jgi:hypothetical protein
VTKPLADGTGTVLICLIYALAGPPIGAIFVAPLASLVEGEVMPSALLGGAWLLLATFPLGLLATYWQAGLLALGTGAAVAAIARRRGSVPLWMAGAAASAIFLAILLLSWATGFAIPGAAALDDPGPQNMPVLLAAAILASLLCCLLTRPIQKRCR